MQLETIYRILPSKISSLINKEKLKELQEIRIRTNRQAILKYDNDEIITDYKPTEKEVIQILQMLCDNSIYSYQTQICNGFITLYGGHRVGITGSIAMKDGKVSNINYISSLNFRIAKEIIGVSDKIIEFIVNKESYNNGKSNASFNDSNDIKSNENYNNTKDNNDIKNNADRIENKASLEINNTLIISKPGTGKTTMLRDIVRNISNMGFTTSLIDERGELAAMYKGVPQNDVGLRTDVMDNVTKSLGMKIAVRSMSPQVIIADEIGTKEDIEAINYGICSGVKGIFTAHAGDINELKMNENLNKLYEQKLFTRLIFLEKKGKIKNMYILDKNMYKSVDEMLA